MTKPAKLTIAYKYDFLVYAIVSSCKEFKLAWYLNELFTIQLKKENDIEYKTKDSVFMASNYIYETEFFTYRLIKNKVFASENRNKPFLLPELKQFDYILQIEGDNCLDLQDFIFNSIKESKVVQHVELINADNLKSKNNLLF